MGRPANSLNKNKAFLLNRLQELYGEDFDPVIKMAENAVELQKIADDFDPKKIKVTNGFAPVTKSTVHKDALSAWGEIAPYIQPKLKAVELSMGDENELPTKIEINVVRPKA